MQPPHQTSGIKYYLSNIDYETKQAVITLPSPALIDQELKTYPPKMN